MVMIRRDRFMRDVDAILRDDGTDKLVAAIAWYIQRHRGVDVSILDEIEEYAEAYEEAKAKRRP